MEKLHIPEYILFFLVRLIKAARKCRLVELIVVNSFLLGAGVIPVEAKQRGQVCRVKCVGSNVSGQVCRADRILIPLRVEIFIYTHRIGRPKEVDSE